jgi:hypothetical protein
VRAVGIEPTLLSELDFESSASTSSTTPASAPGINVSAHAANTRFDFDAHPCVCRGSNPQNAFGHERACDQTSSC